MRAMSATEQENEASTTKQQEIEGPQPTWFGKAAAFLLKLTITAAILGYASRSINYSDLGRLAGTVSPLWICFTVLMIAVQIPLIGLRWCKILDALSPSSPPVP